MKLVQKRLFQAAREFEIIDDAVYVRKKGLLKEEKSTVALSMLNPEPLVNGPELQFHSRARREPMLSLFLDNPNAEEFNAFVDRLKSSVSEARKGIAGINGESPRSSRPEAPGWNAHEEPPELDEPGETQGKTSFQPVNARRVDEDIVMLKTYLNEADIQPLLASLEALKAEPHNEDAFQKMVHAYNELGFRQGAVLTYAAYLKVLLSRTFWSE